MNISRLKYDSINKFNISLGISFLVLAGLILVFYVNEFREPEQVKIICEIYLGIFGVSGIGVLVFGLRGFIEEEGDKKSMANLLKEDKKLDIEIKKQILEEKIQKLSKENKEDKKIPLLKKQKELLDKEKEVVSNLSSTTIMQSGTQAFSSGTQPPFQGHKNENKQNSFKWIEW